MEFVPFRKKNAKAYLAPDILLVSAAGLVVIGALLGRYVFAVSEVFVTALAFIASILVVLALIVEAVTTRKYNAACAKYYREELGVLPGDYQEFTRRLNRKKAEEPAFVFRFGENHVKAWVARGTQEKLPRVFMDKLLQVPATQEDLLPSRRESKTVVPA